MTDKLLLLRKLALLREHADRVRRRRSATEEAFEADVDTQDALALSLLVATQEAADIAMHLAADEGWGLPGSYAEAFDLLAKNGVITAGQGAIAALRNRIAHGYASVDPKRLWREIPAGLDALDQFGRAIATFAES
jgi:uncharacterized protein YutE (UPF0331/DUF86 family)